ncbi:hypothetical protein C8F04DRAFT_1183523 [Mycena alexandri]|uniref:Uncharacterized protein n=1 Tax=Mycena alexandri TaxID=1745969 RepID=A0AAD6X3H6_9AGAR|nr:hypothetical protein C8F04DRAFT_1183523 [Mycena alexandri]
MYRVFVHSGAAGEAQNEDGGMSAPMTHYRKETLVDSQSPFLRASEEAPIQWFSSSNALRLLSLTLHSVLIAIHVALLLVWSRGLEHRIIFSLDHQKKVSFIITAVTTTFGTIYSALLVFVTQTLFTRRSLQITQAVTVIHDTSAAWSGIGSAFLHLWRQTAVRGSAFSVLTALLYLGNILVLHITTPALFSAAAFNSSIDIPVGTQSHLPVFNWSNDTILDTDNLLHSVTGSLYYIPSILGNTTSAGLNNGTLYDVLNDNDGVKNVVVNATGFNVTCGYPPHMNMSFKGTPKNDWLWWGVSVDPHSDYPIINEFPTTQPAMIRPVTPGETYPPNLMLYTTIPIVDSNKTHPPLLDLRPATNDSISHVQIMQCDLSLVPQKVSLEARTQVVLSIEPNITKTKSAWGQYTGPASYNQNFTPDPANTTTGNLFIDLWPYWYTLMPSVEFPVSVLTKVGNAYASDVFLLQQLNLHGPNATYSPNNTVALHDLENALSRLVAAMFWSTTHFLPAVGPSLGSGSSGADDISISQIQPVQNTLPLVQGTAVVVGILTQGRLDIVVGLVASVFLALLALPSIFFFGDKDIAIDGTGVLHAIWMYRNHPELEALLPQVEHPTTENLRKAGMVRTRLIGARLRK